MALLESLRLALEGLMANRLRSILTMLGIVIGVGAVIALVSFGQGVETYIAGQFQALGSNLLFVFSSSPPGGGPGDIKVLTMADAEAIGNPMLAPSVLRVAPQADVMALVEYGRSEVTMSVSGVTSIYQQVRDWYPMAGRFIDENDVLTGARVAVLGTTTARELFGAFADPLGKTIRINALPFRVVGVMAEQPSSGFADENDVIFLPISVTQMRLSRASMRDGSYRVDFLTVQAISEERMEAAAEEIRRILLDRHDIQYADQEDFTILSQNDLLSVVGNITGLLTIFLAVIAGISLLVGGIGIMNIMLVTVTERTREIGLRKAVGARKMDILLQFLIESVVLTITGGAIGIGIGFLASTVGSALIPDLTLSVTGGAIALATTVCTVIGVFFGIYPASRAASLHPIDALRYE
ncbi:MAG: ABC transporter permease [Anaerolineae bacterium]